MSTSTYRNWRLETDPEGIAWVCFDKADASTNTLSAEALQELDRLIAELASQRPRGAVFYSAKTNGFIAGADIGMIGELAAAEDPEKLVRESQGVFDRLASLSTHHQNLPPSVLAVLALGLLTHFAPQRWLDECRERFGRAPAYVQGLALFAVALTLREMAAADAVPFVYFQF